VTTALIAECALLAVLALVHGAVLAGDTERLAGRVALAAVAMGVQSAAARRLAISGVSTTFVTGTLTTLTGLVALHGVLPGAGTQSKRLLFAVWLVYVVGAMAAGAVLRAAPGLSLIPPVLVVLGVAVVAARHDWRAEPALP
jgi:uncharacterized membrane protein YoaK (UPF0700 family)